MLNSVDCEEFLRWMEEAFEREKARKVFIFSDQLRNAIAKRVVGIDVVIHLVIVYLVHFLIYDN